MGKTITVIFGLFITGAMLLPLAKELPSRLGVILHKALSSQ
jgi:hypothetical protein